MGLLFSSFLTIAWDVNPTHNAVSHLVCSPVGGLLIRLQSTPFWEVFLIWAPPGPKSFPLASLGPLGWECPTLFPLGAPPLSWHRFQA